MNRYGRYDTWASFKEIIRELLYELEENLMYDFDKNHSVRLSNWYKRMFLLKYYDK